MMIAPLKWSVHNPYFNYFKPETFYVNNDTSDANSRPLDTYLPDDYIKYKTVTFGSVGFAGKVSGHWASGFIHGKYPGFTFFHMELHFE